MARRMFEFKCDEQHLQVKLVSDEVTKLTCKDCGKEALRIISAPRIALEPFSGTFSGATAKWERNRAEKMKQERKRNEGKDNP